MLVGVELAVSVVDNPGYKFLTGLAVNITIGEGCTFNSAALVVTPHGFAPATTLYLLLFIAVVILFNRSVAVFSPEILVYVAPPSVLTCH